MESILIIDDDDRVRELLFDALSDTYDCRTAANAEFASALLDRKEFATIITDISLPGASGIEILGNMRQNRPETPVIVVSGIQDAGYEKGLLEMGAFGFLGKPLDLDDIDTMVARAISARRQGIEEGHQLRAHRYRMHVEARLSGFMVFDDHEQGVEMIAGITRDLSQTGAGIIIPYENLDPELLIGRRFQLVLGMIEGSLALEAIVVRHEVMDAKRCLIGAKFTNLGGRDRMQLLLYLHSQHPGDDAEPFTSGH